MRKMLMMIGFINNNDDYYGEMELLFSLLMIIKCRL